MASTAAAARPTRASRQQHAPVGAVAADRRHAKKSAAAGTNPTHAADSDDDLEAVGHHHTDQGLGRMRGRTQRGAADPRHDSSSGSSSSEEDDAGSSGDDDEDERANSHAAAAAGPSSAAAAAATRKKPHSTPKKPTTNKSSKSSSKKRPAGVAFQDAISLLPADLDVETLVRVRQQLQPRNRMQKQALLQSYRQQHQHWRFLLRQRFSLLFYGLGSKRMLLEAFAQEALTDGGVLACDGLAAGVNSKQVLQAVASALTHRSCKSHSHSELLSLIVAEPPCRQLYLLLHNIDGPGLRSAEEQLWLSRLSQAPCVRLVASVDHVNAALLWNSRVAAAFNWLWVEGTTYAGYDAETCNVAPIITSCKQSATKRGATTVLSTLVTTAREVFKVLATQQLEDPSAPGVSFPLLLRVAREKFIVNSEHALKSVLTEFRDHELIKLRPGPDGGEVMYVPMEPDMLQGALQEMQAADAEAAAAAE